jgi:hypothetical protein
MAPLDIRWREGYGEPLRWPRPDSLPRAARQMMSPETARLRDDDARG